MKHKVLIVTFREDYHSIRQIEAFIQKNGGEVICWYVDEYLTQNTLSSIYKDGDWQLFLRDGNKIHTLNDVTAIWNRRYNRFAQKLQGEMDLKYFEACGAEAKTAVKGVMTRLEKSVFILNEINKSQGADIKEEGMRLALECGFKIPDTCISNDPQLVYDFIRSCKKGAISKTVQGVTISEDGQHAFVQTNDVSQVSLEDLQSVRYCPMIFQERIDKKLELRATIVGEKVFTASIDSQKNEKGEVDWRKAGVETINDWKAYDLPEDIKTKLVMYQKKSGLNYGAADIIVTPDDEYVFLEVNAVGEFNWLDHLFENKISEEIAKILSGQVARL